MPAEKTASQDEPQPPASDISTPAELTEKLLWPEIPGGLSDETIETINVLAQILGVPRQEPKVTTTSAWAAALLGVAQEDLTKVERSVSDTQLLLHGHVLSQWIDGHKDKVELFGPYGRAPEWHPLPLGEEHTRSVPYHLSTYFPAGTHRDQAFIIHICGGHPADVKVYAEPGGRELAESILDEFKSLLAGPGNPFRGRVFQAGAPSSSRISLEPIAVSSETRDDIVLPDTVWHEVELFLAAGTGRRHDLLKLGLSTSRGLLLAGNPGVGKTKLGRILAAEVAGDLTVIITELNVLIHASEALYSEIEQLGPTLVILEDIDAVASKGSRSSSSFSEFLNALDGARVRDGVLTFATTNDPGSLDPAIKRPGRFDVIVEVPLPDLAARDEILRLYLPNGGEGLDTRLIAEGLDGASGADLREVSRRGVLEHGLANITTQALLEITRTGRWKPAPSTGNYL